MKESCQWRGRRPTDSSGGMGRVVSYDWGCSCRREDIRAEISTAIIGLCFRDGRADQLYTWIPSQDELKDMKSTLCQRWGYTKKQASELRQERKAYCCLGIPADEDLMGVIFMDSANEQAFKDEERILRVLNHLRRIISRLL